MFSPLHIIIFAAFGIVMFAEFVGGLNENASFWAIIVLILTSLLEMIRRSVQRKWDKQDKAQEKLDLQAEREREKADRDEIARKVKEEAEQVRRELNIFHAQQKLSAEIGTHEIVNKIDEQNRKVEEIDKKVVTLPVADGHKKEVIEAVRENTKEAAEGRKEAHEAFEIANTINEKLEAQQEAFANKTDKRSEKNIKEIEAIEKIKDK